MTKVLIIGSQHGNELIGFHFITHLGLRRRELLRRCDFVIANPAAVRAGKRYIETDMNRSYRLDEETYESKRAANVLRYIDDTKPDLVLDLHTTRCIQPPCLIVTGPSLARQKFVASSMIRRIVVMPDDIARHSLIGVCERAVSIEVSEGDLGARLYEHMADDIERFINNTSLSQSRDTYLVTGKLTKGDLTQAEVSTLRNFKDTKFGFVPILVGENSYKLQTDYLGFKARRTYTHEL